MSLPTSPIEVLTLIAEEIVNRGHFQGHEPLLHGDGVPTTACLIANDVIGKLLVPAPEDEVDVVMHKVSLRRGAYMEMYRRIGADEFSSLAHWNDTHSTDEVIDMLLSPTHAEVTA